ncbi:MAG: peptidoglycan editing factor PgeF [Candidatus Poribacteria bacterium]|nr:peptidoglycan editing factor PgeF [Candidatus Poribacteria bacterium]MDE0504593.1 peptidoglycan editing factor PgeF [Candidatus Poribacteria bacterium]
MSSLFRFQNLSNQGGVNHFVSTRIGGLSLPPYESLNLGFHVGDVHETVLKNRERLSATIQMPLPGFTFAKQIHSNTVTVVTAQMRGRGTVDYDTAVEATDAMVTSVPGLCLTVLTADCVPVLLFDPRNRVVAAVHAGWRGSVKLIARNTVEILIQEFNCKPRDLLVGIGPSIGPCHYEIGHDVIAQVKDAFGGTDGYINVELSSGKGYFNLWEANRRQIMDVGIPPQNIEVARICTYCDAHRFFSVRHQKGTTGRFGAGIMLST